MRIDYIKVKEVSISAFKKLAAVSFGAMLLAISYNALVIPYGLLSGGIGGISLILTTWRIFPFNGVSSY